MKKKKWLVSAVAVAMLFTTQPVYAAGTNIQVYGSPVVTVGQGPGDNSTGQSGSMPGTNASGMNAPGTSETGINTPGTNAPGMSMPGTNASGNSAPGSNGAQDSFPGSGVNRPGGNQPGAGQPGVSQPGVSQPGGSPAPVSGQVMPGDEQTSLSPVVTAGSGQSAGQQAADAAAQQAQQAAADAAAQRAAQQAAADAAAQQAAAAAAQQSGGRTVDPSKPMVALTFDDGPQTSVGSRIMDCLAQYGGKATFFMVGERVSARRAEVQRMVREGHEVANHTMNHKYLQKLGAAEIQAQVTKCNDVIEAACGVRPRLMRLPGGNHNSTVTANTHMPMIQWNIDTLDWKTKNADKTVAAVLDHVKDGDIVLMHELYSQSGDAALRIIPELHRRGFQMVTVSEMAAAKGHALQAGKLYSSFR